MAGKLGWHVDPVTLKVVLPVGISFYTFQTMSYSIDIYRRKMRGTTHLLRVSVLRIFLSPACRRSHQARHTPAPAVFQGNAFFSATKRRMAANKSSGDSSRRWSSRTTSRPLWMPHFPILRRNGAELALATVLFIPNLLRLCRLLGHRHRHRELLGFELMRNFAYPYFRRASASSGGAGTSRCPRGSRTTFTSRSAGAGCRSRMVFNVMVTFMLSGLWHGASWNFLIWGALNGIGVLPDILRPQHSKRNPNEIPVERPSAIAFFKVLVTFSFICLGWVFFRAHTFSGALLVLKRIGTSFLSATGGLLARHDPTDGRIFIVLALFLILEWVRRRYPHPLVSAPGPWRAPVRWLTPLSWIFGWTARTCPRTARWIAYTLLFWTIVYLGTFGSSTFIYFQF
jgi:hypothetical protein